MAMLSQKKKPAKTRAFQLRFDRSKSVHYHVRASAEESIVMHRNLTQASLIVILCLLLLAGVALRAASFAWNTRLQGDVSLFALTAREYVQHDRLFYPLKWEFSDHVAYRTLASPASQHPLPWPFAAGLLGKIFGTEDTFSLLKLLGEVTGIGLLVLVAFAGWRRRAWSATLAGVAFLAFSPVLVDFSANGSSYILSATLLVLATLLMTRFRMGRLPDYALAGLLCGVALQVHSVMLLLPIAFLLFWLSDGANHDLRRLLWKGIIVATASGLATLIPWMLWNYHYFHTPFYSYSTYFFLKQFGLAKTAIFDGVVTTRVVRSPDILFFGSYLRTMGAIVRDFALNTLTETGPFCLALLVAGWIDLFRNQRRTALAFFLPFLFYTLTVCLWATARDRFVVPIIPLTYLVAAVGFAFLSKGRPLWRTLGWICLVGTVAWSLAGFRDQPPTRYYKNDADWAAGYAKMLPLAREVDKLDRGVMLGYASILDGGMETVYWQHQPFVYGRELPPPALEKVVEDFGVRYVWTDPHTLPDAAVRFPRAREILSNDLFHVFELPSFDLFALTPDQQAAAVRDASGLGSAALAPLASTAIRPIEDQVWFGDQIRLVGSATERWEGDLLVDLAWATTASKLPPLQYFVHVTDAQDKIVAQRDGPLGRWPDEPESAWGAGELLRQRARLQLPAGMESEPYQIYVGLYTPEKAERLPLRVNGVPESDGRYRLAAGEWVSQP